MVCRRGFTTLAFIAIGWLMWVGAAGAQGAGGAMRRL